MPCTAAIMSQELQALMHLMDRDPHRIPLRKIDEIILIATWDIVQFSNNKKARALQNIADIRERLDIFKNRSSQKTGKTFDQIAWLPSSKGTHHIFIFENRCLE